MILINKCNKVLNTLVVIILSVMSCLVFINVVLRYGFNSSINLTEEVSRFLFVWLTFLGAILCFNDNSHVRVNFLVNKLSPFFQRIFKVVGNFIMLISSVLIIIGSFIQFELNLENYSPISNIPTAIIYLAALVSGITIAGILIIQMYSDIKKLIQGGEK